MRAAIRIHQIGKNTFSLKKNPLITFSRKNPNISSPSSSPPLLSDSRGEFFLVSSLSFLVLDSSPLISLFCLTGFGTPVLFVPGFVIAGRLPLRLRWCWLARVERGVVFPPLQIGRRPSSRLIVLSPSAQPSSLLLSVSVVADIISFGTLLQLVICLSLFRRVSSLYGSSLLSAVFFHLRHYSLFADLAAFSSSLVKTPSDNGVVCPLSSPSPLPCLDRRRQSSSSSGSATTASPFFCTFRVLGFLVGLCGSGI